LMDGWLVERDNIQFLTFFSSRHYSYSSLII
jgi:hypothetical protein